MTAWTPGRVGLRGTGGGVAQGGGDARRPRRDVALAAGLPVRSTFLAASSRLVLALLAKTFDVGRPFALCCALVAAFLAAPFSAAVAQAQGAPLELAGLRLGADVADFADTIDSSRTEIDIVRRYVTTAAMKPVPGFRSGYVTYGNCEAKGRIARIKMNYEDDSREFFEKLYVTLKKRHGEPRQWRGNPFGTLRVWKWSLKDAGLGDVSIVLQHYSGEDDSFTKGNSIRLAATRLLENERQCWTRQHPDRKLQAPAPAPPTDIDAYLPR